MAEQGFKYDNPRSRWCDMDLEGRSAPDAYGWDEKSQLRRDLRQSCPDLTEEQLDSLVGLLSHMLAEVDGLVTTTLERLAGVLEQKRQEDLTGLTSPGLKLAAQIVRKTAELY